MTLMTPYYSDDWLTVYQGDCREVMRTLEPESVHCVVTSPPYWGLRDYGTATWVGGDEACDHRIGRTNSAGNKGHVADILDGDRTRCSCGAVRQDAQLGLEPTPEEYVANMVAVFREVRRVLRSDGTVWLNLGDSYADTGKSGGGDQGRRAENGSGAPTAGRPGEWKNFRPPPPGLKPKDLVGIPWRVAFALQADGWYLRSDIIWAKPNPMPESVTDRPTKSHEYLFLLSKSARYFWDADAVREDARYGYSVTSGVANSNEKWKASVGDARSDPTRQSTTVTPGDGTGGRNIRSVWTIATQPYPGAHFATFPRKLVEPCIKAGCPEGGAVLDPFAGSGTTALVAQALSRRAILIDLSVDYLDQALHRNRQTPMGLVG